MFRQAYSEVRPLTTLLRRLLAEGCPIADVPARVASMEASGEIEILQSPRQRLPSQWWLVQLSSGRLSIETDDPDRPLDPNQFLYRERLPPPGHDTIVIQSEGLKARRAMLMETAVTAPPIEPVLPLPPPQEIKSKPKSREPGGGRRPKFEAGQLAWLRQRYHVAVKADPLLAKHEAAVPYVQGLAKTDYNIDAGRNLLLDQIIRPVLRP